MIRISGVSIEDNQQIRFGLTRVKGVGKSNVKPILDKLKIEYNAKAGDLTEEQVVSIRKELENYITEEDLTRQVKENIKRVVRIKTYKGLRHKAHMPVRGQRTKTNSRTVRGNVRNTAGSGRAKSAGLT